VQRGLESLYRIDTELDVKDFMIDAAQRAALAPARAPREQLLVAELPDSLELALFVDGRALANLAANDPRRRLDDSNLEDFLLTVEGVSHFVYVAWRARQARPVSALELELQAEVDKWVTCALTTIDQGGAPGAELRARLFDRFTLEPGMDGEERERYLCANSNARAYAGALEARYVARGAVAAMLGELRRFYRMGAQEKLGLIAAA
jgi:hypothetical protein